MIEQMTSKEMVPWIRGDGGAGDGDGGGDDGGDDALTSDADIVE